MNEPQLNHDADLPPAGGSLDRSLELVEFLRANCAWDAVQTPASLLRHLLEEAHETADAIARGDDADLHGELGDLLLNVAFQVVLAEERGAFDRAAVVNALEAKIRRRHPHLFGLGAPEDWERIKSRERADGLRSSPGGLLADVAVGGDPLFHAHRLQRRVAEVGFDWPDAEGALDKVREEVEEVGRELQVRDPERIEEEIGDLLFSVVNLARLLGAHPPAALSRANAKFRRRFAAVEHLAQLRGIAVADAGLDVLDSLWQEAKENE